MPYLETLDELVEDLADKLGYYNAGPEDDIHPKGCKCRVCFVVGMNERILTAVENTRHLTKSQINLMRSERNIRDSLGKDICPKCGHGKPTYDPFSLYDYSCDNCGAEWDFEDVRDCQDMENNKHNRNMLHEGEQSETQIHVRKPDQNGKKSELVNQ